MTDAYKKAFLALFHVNAEIMLAINTQAEEKRRKIDGWIKHKNEQIDAIVLGLPKEDGNGSDH